MFDDFPLKFRVAQGKPSPEESKFQPPGPNYGPAYLGRTLSLKDYAAPEEYGPDYLDMSNHNFRK